MTYTILSAAYANPDHTAATVATREAGAVAASIEDTPELWVAMLDHGEPEDYTPTPTVPETISDRQFAQILALSRIITRDEAVAWAARGDLPTKLSEAVATIPDEDMRFGARMLLSSATTYERHHPLVGMLASQLKPGGYSDAELDALWTQAVNL